LLVTAISIAHEIPRDATVHALIRPQGQKLQLIFRAPLGVIRDIAFPEDTKGYLQVESLDPVLTSLVTAQIGSTIELYENDRRLPQPSVAATQISLESDRSFKSFDEAIVHVMGPKLRNEAQVVWNQVYLDVLFEYAITSERSAFSIRPRFERLAADVVTILRYVVPGGEVRPYELHGDPGMLPLDPGWFQSAWRFLHLGFTHILEGVDHLLFLLALVIPFRSFRSLVLIVTAFTAAHSITLMAAVFDFAPDRLWFPPMIETLIAASIVYMCLENIVGVDAHRRRWIVAFCFGLIHGFGFSFALRETLQFAGSHLLVSLLSFNIGIEIGQLVVLAILIPALDLLFRYVVAERMGTIILSAFVAHTGWHWMIERAGQLRLFR
jgi:hydrogenase/urease accessory protein HupE